MPPLKALSALEYVVYSRRGTGVHKGTVTRCGATSSAETGHRKGQGYNLGPPSSTTAEGSTACRAFALQQDVSVLSPQLTNTADEGLAAVLSVLFVSRSVLSPEIPGTDVNT